MARGCRPSARCLSPLRDKAGPPRPAVLERGGGQPISAACSQDTLCGLRSLAHLKASSFMSGLAFPAALGSGVARALADDLANEE
jgi:hypothetical protein